MRNSALLSGCAVLLLAGCGSGGTTTVTVSSAPQTQSASTTSTSAQTKTSTRPKTSQQPVRSTATTPTAPASGGQPKTRTAAAPAFTERQQGAGGATGAAAIVRAHGYTPNDLSNYHDGQTLTVLVGTRSGSGDGYGQQAFFFVNGRYIGTDASQPSATLKVVNQSDTAITLSYPLYRARDPLCCPSAGHANVTFELNNGRLAPLQTIPPASSASGLSRQ